jgi:hypothetical protein
MFTKRPIVLCYIVLVSHCSLSKPQIRTKAVIQNMTLEYANLHTRIAKLPTPKSTELYGPIQEGGCWRPRWNNELYSLYKEPDILEDIKIRRLGWAGI